MNKDIYDTIFETLLQLLRQGLVELDVKFLVRWWHLSALLGSRGQVIAKMLSKQSSDLFHKIKRSDLQLRITHHGFEDVVTLWRLQRLASLLLEGNESKLTKPCSRKEYKSIYHLLKLEKKIGDKKTFILYAYFYVLTAQRKVNLQALTRSYVSRTSELHDRKQTARHLRIDIERFLEEKSYCRSK